MSALEHFPTPGDPMARDAFSAGNAMLDWIHAIAPYGVFTTDAQLRIRSWNHWLVTHSGLSADKVVGRPLFEVFPDPQTTRFEEHFRRALTGEVSMLSTALHKYLLPLPVSSGDYSVSHMLQTVRIAPLPAGEMIIGTITIIEDVTQRECQALILQRQQERDRLLSEALGVLLQSTNPLMDVAALFPKIALSLGLDAFSNYLYDADSQTLRLNAAGGIPPKQKESVAVLLPGEGLSGHCAQRREKILINHVQSSTGLEASMARAGGLRACCCFPLLISDRLVGTLAFGTYVRDIIPPDEVEFLSTIALYMAIAMDRALRENALYLAQRSLLEHADILEAKVAERTGRLHETIAQLESFSYTVAHDLRAPIRSLKGYCEILLSEYKLPSEGHLILERLQRASNRLDTLTRDLLKFSKITREEIVLEPVDIAELVQDIRLMMPAVHEDMLIVQPPLEKVWAQRTLLQQSLSNLFDNALKFGREGVRPRIVVRCERRSAAKKEAATPGGTAFNPATRRGESGTPFVDALPGRPEARTANETRVQIWVEDNGIGIAAEAHEKIFGIFERVRGVEHIEGTGIGLAIVARAMEQMGGSCGVESVPGRGSRFWLELAPADGPAPARRSK